MRVERDTLGYMIREEIGRDKLKERAGLRVWRFERRLCEGKENQRGNAGEREKKEWKKESNYQEQKKENYYGRSRIRRGKKEEKERNE